MAKLLNPTWMEIQVSTTDGDYPVTLTLWQEWTENGITYTYQASSSVSNFSDAGAEMTGLTSDIADLANP